MASGLDSGDRQLGVAVVAVQLDREAVARRLGKPTVDRIHREIALLFAHSKIEIDALLVARVAFDADLVIASCIRSQAFVSAYRDPAVDEHFFGLFELCNNCGTGALEIVEFVLHFTVYCVGKLSPRGVRNRSEAHGKRTRCF